MHKLWIHVRNASARRFLRVLTIYVIKNKKICIPLYTPVSLRKWVLRGYTFHGHVIVMCTVLNKYGNTFGNLHYNLFILMHELVLRFNQNPLCIN